jgi:OmpA-OmpF porin, OOP family
MLGRTLAIATSVTLLVGATDTATVPTVDKKGSKDNPVLKRYEGSIIVGYETKAFDELTLPLSPLLVQKEDERDRNNNRRYEPKTKKELEGRYTRIVYLIPPDRSPLEVLRNYQDEITSKGGKVLFDCKAETCGGDTRRSSGGGGGDMSLAMYLYPGDRLTDQQFTIGRCVQEDNISGQRFIAAELPNGTGHVAVHTYTVVAPYTGDTCHPVNERTIAAVHIVEAKARETKMVTVNATEMAAAISSTGHVALYGIYFDFNKADLKPESDPTLEQIGKLLKSSPTLKVLIVGHTDNVGSFAFNMDLSQRRAAAVVAALTTRYGISKDRLAPVGVSFASPVAPNTTEEGRAKNRRVELVEHATTQPGKTS